MVNQRVDPRAAIEEPWLWNWRGLVSYIVPKVDVQVSAIMRSQANIQSTNDPASSGLSQNAQLLRDERKCPGSTRSPNRGRCPRDDAGPGEAG